MSLLTNYRKNNATATLLDMSPGNAVTIPGGISVFSGDGTVTVEDTTDPQYLTEGATKALKITITPGAVSTRIRPVFTIAGSTLADFRTMSIPYWVLSGSLGINSVHLADAGLANYFAWDGRNGTGIGTWQPGANLMYAVRGVRQSTTGTAAYGTTTFARIRFDIQALAGSGPVVIIIGNVVTNIETRPQLVLVFDDQSDTQYSEAFSYMATRGLVGSIAFASSFHGLAGKLTTGMIDEMLAAGWSIHNHSDQHPSLSGSATSEFAKADAKACKDILASFGWDRNNIYVAPGAALNVASWSGIQELGYKYNVVGDALSGYGDLNATAYGVAQQNNHVYRCSNREATSAAGLTYFLGRLDEAEATGRSMGFIIHSITNTATNLAPADFKLLIDNIYRRVAGGRMDCVNLEEYVRRFDSPRKAR